MKPFFFTFAIHFKHTCMKKIFTLLLLLVAFTVSNTYAQLLTEKFDYPADATLGLSAQSGGVWTRVNSGDSILVAAGSLSYPGFASSSGNKITFGGAGTDYWTAFANQTSGKVYYSFLLRVPTIAPLTTTGDYFFGFIENNSATNFFGRLWMRSAAGGYNIGINAGSAGSPSYSSTVLTEGATYLIVGSFEMVAGSNNDVSQVWVNPISLGAAEPAADATATNTGTDPTGGIQRLILRQGSATAAAGVLEMDEIRVGTTWAEVTPVLVSTPVLAATGSVNLTTAEGTASAPQSFNVSGANLTGFPGNIAVSSASPDIELSLNSGGPFTAAVNIPYTGATLAATPVYARISADATIGAVSSLVTVSGGGAPNATITVSGSVTAPQPTVQATGIIVSDITDNSLTINWTNGNGGARLVVIRQTTATAIPPADATTYTANPAVTGASSTGTGNFVVYNGSGTGPVTITNLFTGTNYTIKVYEYDGGPTEENYLLDDASGNPVAVSTTGISSVMQQGYFTSVSTPLYAARSSFRVPTVYVATVSGLAPNTTYRYYSQAAATTDFGTTNSGAGAIISADYTTAPVAFITSSLGSLSTDGSYGKFTTNAAGSFTGTFGFFSSTNARFNAGSEVYPALTIGEDIATPTIRYRFALDQSITMLNYATTNGANDGSFITGKSGATPNNVVALWKSTDGNLRAGARPIAMTLVEDNATTTTMSAPYDESNGSWNTIIPNTLPEGVRLIQQFTPFGVLVGCKPDADGIWGATNTQNPTNGSATALEIAAVDAPLTDLVDCNGILPVSLKTFAVQKAGNSTRIFWTTEQEINSKEFIVERSTDGGRTWTAIATVAAAGNSNAAINYTTTDFSPAKGINFYRLKIVDIDSKFSNSVQRSVLFGNADVVLITPNPATSFANIYMGKAGNSLSEIIVTDMNGKQVERVRTTQQTYSLSTANYSKGVYVIKVISEAASSTHKLLVQ